MALLEVKDLTIHYRTKTGPLVAVDSVSFDIPEGQNLGLVGESGCGKTTTAKALIRLLPSNGSIVRGQMKYKDTHIEKLTDKELRAFRWEEISMISQSAMNSLNPVFRVGDQIVEAIQAHRKDSRNQAMKRAEELFDVVGLEKKRLRAYPHEMSGGMKQRAIIAMAMALDPGLIIADEPTTALDVIVQDRILKKIVEVQKNMKSSMVFITHDISVVAETCQRVCVMYAGKVMELGPTSKVFKAPYHPYTMGLSNAFPSIQMDQSELISIPGYPPNLINPPKGCLFFERCPFATTKCENEAPPVLEIDDDHFAACHYSDQYLAHREAARRRKTWDDVRQRQIERGVV